MPTPTIDLTGAIYQIFTSLIETNIFSTYVNEMSGYPLPPPTPVPIKSSPPPLSALPMTYIETQYYEIKKEIENITEEQLNKLNSSVIIKLDKLYHYDNRFIDDENNQKINFIEYINKYHSIELTSLCLDSNRNIKHPTILLYLMRCGLNAEQFIYEEITRKRFLSYDVYSTFSPDIFLQDAKSFFMKYYLPNFKTDPKYKKNSYQKFLIESQNQASEQKGNREDWDKLIKNTFKLFIGGLGRILPGGSKSSRNKRKTNNRRRTKRRRLRPRYRS